jgi:hypothetical protein
LTPEAAHTDAQHRARGCIRRPGLRFVLVVDGGELGDHSGLANDVGWVLGPTRTLLGRTVIQGPNISCHMAQIQAPIGLIQADAEPSAAAREVQPTDGSRSSRSARISCGCRCQASASWRQPTRTLFTPRARHCRWPKSVATLKARLGRCDPLRSRSSFWRARYVSSTASVLTA